MPDAYIYLRCSHGDSAESGMGLADQEQAAIRLAESLREQAWIEEVIVLRDEIVSAFKTKLFSRQDGRRLLEAKQGDYVIFAYLDRGFRNVPDMRASVEFLRGQGVHVHFADIGTAQMDRRTAFIAENIHAVLAEYRSVDTSERTKAALAQVRRQTGITSHKPPRGFKRQYSQWLKKPVAVPDEDYRRMCNDIVRWRDVDRLKWAAIAKKLPDKPHPSTVIRRYRAAKQAAVTGWTV